MLSAWDEPAIGWESPENKQQQSIDSRCRSLEAMSLQLLEVSKYVKQIWVDMIFGSASFDAFDNKVVGKFYVRKWCFPTK